MGQVGALQFFSFFFLLEDIYKKEKRLCGDADNDVKGIKGGPFFRSDKFVLISHEGRKVCHRDLTILVLFLFCFFLFSFLLLLGISLF